MEGKKVVVVIGGGFGGIGVIQKLADKKEFFVVLIDRKNYFFNHFATLRAATHSTWEERPLVPYTSMFSRGNGQFIQAEVERIEADGVKIYGVDETIKYDYLVVGTGSAYNFPNSVAAPKAEDAIKAFKDTQEKIAKALKITIVGAGPVGVELAGEITHAHGESKKITIVHADQKPLHPIQSDKFRDKVLKLLQGYKNVSLVMGEKVVLSEAERGHMVYLEGKRTLKTNKGTEIETDLVFFCVGSSINNASFIDTFPLDTATGRIEVEKTLQVKGFEKIFAVGDVANSDNKLGFVAMTQGGLVADNIIHLNSGNLKKVKEYSKVGMMGMGIPFGSEDGVSRMGSFVLGSWVTGKLKGKELGVNRIWKSFKLELPDFEHAKKDSTYRHASFKPTHSFENSDVELLAKHLKVTKDTARSLLQGVEPSQASQLVNRS